MATAGRRATASALQPTTQDGLGLNPVAGGDDRPTSTSGRLTSRATSTSRPTRSSCCTTCATRAATPSPACRRARSHVARQRVDDYAAGWLAAGLTRCSSTPSSARPGTSTPRSAAAAPSRRRGGSAPDFHDHVIAVPERAHTGRDRSLDPDTRGPRLPPLARRTGRVAVVDIRNGGRGIKVTPGVQRHGLSGIGSGGRRDRPAGGRQPPREGWAPRPARCPRRASPSASGASRHSTGVLVAEGPRRSGSRSLCRRRRPSPTGTELGVRWVPVVLDDPGTGSTTPRAPTGADHRAHRRCRQPRRRRPATSSPRPTRSRRWGTVGDGEPATRTRAVPSRDDGARRRRHRVRRRVASARRSAPRPGQRAHLGRVHRGVGPLGPRRRDTTIDVRVANDGCSPERGCAVGARPGARIADGHVDAARGRGRHVGGSDRDRRPAGPGRLDHGPAADLRAGPAGSYLMVLDIVSPIYGSLLASGLPPVTVRVTVGPGAGPAPTGP